MDNENNVFNLNYGAGHNQRNTVFAWVDKSYASGGNAMSFDITNEIRTNRNLLTFKSNIITYGSVSKTIATKTSDNSSSLEIFGHKLETGAIEYFGLYDMKLYSFNIYEGDKLLKKYIPCLDNNNRPCLYEVLEGISIYNSGSSEFSYN